MASLTLPGPSEAETLKQISDYLDVLQHQGRLIWIRHNSTRFAMRDGKLRGVKTRESQKGAPDILVWQKLGNFCVTTAIEAKAPNGEQSAEQKEWQKAAERIGLRYVVCRSFDEFRKETGL